MRWIKTCAEKEYEFGALFSTPRPLLDSGMYWNDGTWPIYESQEPRARVVFFVWGTATSGGRFNIDIETCQACGGAVKALRGAGS